MPDDRFLHRVCGHSRKVNALTSEEFRVWVQYELSADDFGVMLFSSRPLRADNDYLDTKSPKVVQRWLERVRDLGLIRTFEHQDQLYCYQHDWQDYQKIEYPRTAILPRPPDEALADCTPLTRYLFQFYPGGVRVPSAKREGSGSIPGILPEDSDPSRARSRTPARPVPANGERQTAKANGSGGAGGEIPADARSKHPVFKGQRFVVFDWMLEDLRRLLGSAFDAFDVHAWFYALDARAGSADMVVPQRDGGKWLQEQTLEEAERRGIAIAATSRPTNSRTAGNVGAAAKFIARGKA